jgi:hypothetical protein
MEMSMNNLRVWIFLGCFAWLVPVFGQSTTGPKPPSTASLSKPVDMRDVELRLFEDTSEKVKFSLVTSWIPGEKHEGMFRYKLFVVAVSKPDSGNGLTSESDKTSEDHLNSNAAEKLLNRVSECSIFLDLFDKDDFILRHHLVPFARGVNHEARLNSLFSNDSFQMDVQGYRDFIKSGSWTIVWRCGSAP